MKSLSMAGTLRRLCFVLAVQGSVGSAMAQAQSSSTKEDAVKNETEIILDIDGSIVHVSLEDSAATRDFLGQLPLTLNFEDYHGIEKVSDLPRRLSTEGAPAGFDPQVGSFTYYAPWGNLAIFYRDFGYSRSLVNLGTVTSGLEYLSQSDSFTATISVAR